MKDRLTRVGLPPLMYKRYVDDINTSSRTSPPGLRYRDGQGIIDVTCIVEDEALEDDDRFFRLFQTIGNRIHPSIQLEVDFPSRHYEKSVPILDLREWTDQTENGEYRVMHEFYRKDVSSKAVVDARSALPWNIKRTVLTQEVLRIMLNCFERHYGQDAVLRL